LKLHLFVLFFSYFQQLFKIKDPFYYFWLYCGSDSGTSICWLQRCIKILFLQCNLTWKTEQLTNYKCSLIQYGDENDSEVLVQNFIASLSILCFLKKLSSEPCLHLFLLGAAIACLIRVLLYRRNIYNFVSVIQNSS
jgi:hypothetical protein